ncbi:histone methyltransferase set2 [Didymella heteroderae]|uniref:Histone methyltransferase set2 n=1 Tax=Didymella heteroderae TaxID=1769908 RepID=A0A9P5BXQ9_9PLEO|nr:histone methyltransferase set2 [Didymella heteroderae]
MVTQRQVYFDIMHEVKEHDLEHAKRRVVEYQRRLYATNLEGNLRFYSQDKDGIPYAMIPTVIDGKKFYSTLLSRNYIKRRAWQESPNGPDKPENWNWTEWPPRTANDLIGCKSVCEFCAERDDPDTPDRTRLDHAYTEWIARALDFWHNNIFIWKKPKLGFGLYARNRIPEGTHIGEYTGLIVPYYGDENDGMDSYNMEIDGGPRLPKDPRLPDDPLPQFICRLDATKKGSIFRFMNHSCDPSAKVVQMRYGIHHRIVVVVATEDIEPGDPITIFYSKDWFNDGNPCWCRETACKWERRRTREKAEAGASDLDAKTNRSDTGRTERDKAGRKPPQKQCHR